MTRVFPFDIIFLASKNKIQITSTHILLNKLVGLLITVQYRIIVKHLHNKNSLLQQRFFSLCRCIFWINMRSTKPKKEESQKIIGEKTKAWKLEETL